MSNVRPLYAPSPRIAAKVRAALEFRAREGLSIAAAAEKAGMSRNGFAEALKRPAVQDLMQEIQSKFVLEHETRVCADALPCAG
jgi:hypothetical protein